MSDQAAQQSVLRDLVALTKPSIAGLSMFMTIGGYLLAGAGDLTTTLWAVVGTALIVGSANALNMAWEHETDALMTRTAERPIPAGRLSVRTATLFGLAWGLSGLGALFLGVNARSQSAFFLSFHDGDDGWAGWGAMRPLSGTVSRERRVIGIELASKETKKKESWVVQLM